MWVLTEYEATTFFSLKPATATASGGKTLLVPTPFAIKMALLDVACRIAGQAAAETAWAWLRQMTVALRPPEQVVVNNTFIKVLKPRRNPAEEGSQDAGYFMRTITYREYAQLFKPFGIGLEMPEDADLDALRYWLANINYLGKRGSFIQMTSPPETVDALPLDYVIVDGVLDGQLDLDTILTQLDDSSDSVEFEKVSIYDSSSIRLGKERLLLNVALPYRQIASSRGYTHYQRSDE